jgi:oxygen-independent coproporphyrinogen-3 oxidase
MQAFLPALKQEMDWARSTFQIQPATLFFGGGTPSALSVAQLEDLFTQWPWTGAAEFTVEANPLTISSRKAAVLRAAGVNRISLGVQAFDDAPLHLLGRTHRRADIHTSMDTLRHAGFTNINIDLMFSLPGQTPAQWEAALREAIALQPDHISTYNLTYEEDTEFLRRFQTGDFRQTEADNRTMFTAAMDLLESAGYLQYEISNFARPGFECAHNQSIWQGHDYLGLGPSAVSTVGQTRWKNIPDTLGYARALASTGTPPRLFEDLTPEARRNERVLLTLRTHTGIDPADIPQPGPVPDLIAEGLLESSGPRLRLTRAGKLVADSITELLIS